MWIWEWRYILANKDNDINKILFSSFRLIYSTSLKSSKIYIKKLNQKNLSNFTKIKQDIKNKTLNKK